MSDRNATDAPYFEKYGRFPYGSPEWKKLYNKRVLVERVFGRLEMYRKLDAIRTRRLAKMCKPALRGAGFFYPAHAS